LVEVFADNNRSAWKKKRVSEVDADGVVTVVRKGDRLVYKRMLADLRTGRHHGGPGAVRIRLPRLGTPAR
jgi:hypothetical protein